MYKHVGRHGDKKIVILYREIPGEGHMCLVVYSDLLPRLYHDSVMQVLESAVGQQAENFSDALFRNYMPDGRNCLEALHKDGLMKKVQTNQVVMTPTPATSIRLDELNGILNEMAKGEDAIKRLSEIDANNGLANSKRKPIPKELGVSPASRTQPIDNINVGAALSDADLARSRLSQAETMKASAAQLIAEAERLTKEAEDLDPTTHVKPRDAKTKKAKAQAA